MTHLVINDGIVLRRFEERDATALNIFRNDAAAVGLLGGFSSGFSLQDAHDWIAYHRKRADEVLWAIATADDDRCVGHVGLYKLDHRVRKAEFGILIGDTGFHGRGFGKSITARVIRYGFNELNLHRISLSLLAANSRAHALYTGLGFKEEGRLRDDDFRGGTYGDTIVMGLLAHDWPDADQ